MQKKVIQKQYKEYVRMFRKIDEGIVRACAEEKWIASGSRLAILPDGSYICVYVTESDSGVNDFVPEVAYSKDGIHWSESKPIWPEYIGKKSMTASVRNTDDGRISIAGMALDIAYPGEYWWSDELAAMKENKLVYAISEDGYSFPAPTFVDLPYYGACEMPGGMQIDKDGTMSIVYAPYPTIEQREPTDTNCLVLMQSTDGGETWESSKIGQVEGKSLYAETWIATLADGAKMITTWQTASEEAPDQYLYAGDGVQFAGPYPLPFKGQSTALTTLPDGRVLIAYNQRKEKPVGVWVAVARPDADGLHMITDEPAWIAASGTRKADAVNGDFSEWTAFSFGEPHIIPTPDGAFLLTFWYAESGVKGIKTVKLACEG